MAHDRQLKEWRDRLDAVTLALAAVAGIAKLAFDGYERALKKGAR